jgi:hypothetical protein
MKTEFMKAIIEDLQVKNCEQKQVDALLNCYEGVVKRMAAMLVRTATFETDDFYRASERGIAGFTIKIEKTHYGDTDQWWGVFTKGDQEVKAMATLDKMED